VTYNNNRRCVKSTMILMHMFASHSLKLNVTCSESRVESPDQGQALTENIPHAFLFVHLLKTSRDGFKDKLQQESGGGICEREGMKR
jgi:hypothetical protein